MDVPHAGRASTRTGRATAKIIIRPTPPSPGSNAQHEPIDWVKASYDSIHGEIVSQWKVDGDRFQLEVTIPANTTATVYVPAAEANRVTESGKPLSQSENLQVLEQQGDRVLVLVQSGSYCFVSTGGIRPATASLKTTN